MKQASWERDERLNEVIRVEDNGTNGREMWRVKTWKKWEFDEKGKIRKTEMRIGKQGQGCVDAVRKRERKRQVRTIQRRWVNKGEKLRADDSVEKQKVPWEGEENNKKLL